MKTKRIKLKALYFWKANFCYLHNFFIANNTNWYIWLWLYIYGYIISFFQKYKYFQSCYISHYFVQYKHVNYTNLGRFPILEVGKVSHATCQISKVFPDFSSLIVNLFFKLIFSFTSDCWQTRFKNVLLSSVLLGIFFVLFVAYTSRIRGIKFVGYLIWHFFVFVMQTTSFVC